MIAFWVGMFAVVMLLLMCFEPRGKQDMSEEPLVFIHEDQD